MRKFKRKCLKICIKCKTMAVSKTGEGRKFNLCVRCYRVAREISSKVETSEAKKVNENRKAKLSVIKKRNNGCENSDYWKKTKRVRIKMRYRYIAIQVYGPTCMMCGADSSHRRIEVDHIFPVSKYPELEFDLNNSQILCEDCNCGKSNKSFDDFRSIFMKNEMNTYKKGMPENSPISIMDSISKNEKSFRGVTEMEKIKGIMNTKKKTIIRKSKVRLNLAAAPLA